MIQSLQRLFREFKVMGVDWVMAAGKKAQGINAFSITIAADPEVLTFAAQGLPDMADDEYLVVVHGETTNRIVVDESSKTAAGFSIDNGVAAEVAHCIIIGRLAGMKAE